MIKGNSIPCEEKKVSPVLFSTKETCCGCSACYSSCPVDAIKMKTDDEGFLYPVIDEKKCVKCYKCISACAFKYDLHKKKNSSIFLINIVNLFYITS